MLKMAVMIKRWKMEKKKGNGQYSIEFLTLFVVFFTIFLSFLALIMMSKKPFEEEIAITSDYNTLLRMKNAIEALYSQCPLHYSLTLYFNSDMNISFKLINEKNYLYVADGKNSFYIPLNIYNVSSQSDFNVVRGFNRILLSCEITGESIKVEIKRI